MGLRYNLRRNPAELVRNIPSAVRAGWARAPGHGHGHGQSQNSGQSQSSGPGQGDDGV